MVIGKRSIVLFALTVIVSLGLVGCPGRPVMEVSATAHHFGLNLDQSHETVWTFQLWNGSSSREPLVFDVAATKPWIAVTPATGQSTGPADKKTITVTIDREYSELAKTAPEWLSGQVNITSDVGNKVVQLTTAPDYFTQEFDSDLDVSGKSLAFIPDGSLSFYAATQEDVADFPQDPAGGAVLDFGIADPVEVHPWYGAKIPFYDNEYDTFFVSSGGFVTFGEQASGAKAAQTLAEHFDLPRISGLSTVDAAVGGTVSVLQDAEKLTVTYENVPTADKQADNNFQIEMFYDGQIRVTYLDMGAASGIAGLSYGPGGGVPGDYVPSDLSSYNTPGLKAAY